MVPRRALKGYMMMQPWCHGRRARPSTGIANVTQSSGPVHQYIAKDTRSQIATCWLPLATDEDEDLHRKQQGCLWITLVPYALLLHLL